MPDEKGGSDLDVFEGLGKKPTPSSDQGRQPEPSTPRKAPAGPATIRGGFSSPSPSGRALPPPSKVPRKPQPSGVELPKPKPPPSKSGPPGPGPSQPVSLPKPKPPPSKASHSDAPEVVVGTDFSGIFDEASSQGSILPGGVAADLDWDDEEEATHVFDRPDHDLFGDLASRPGRPVEADDTARRYVASAAALLKQSGGTAKPVSVPAPAAVTPVPTPAPAFPTPAAVPQDAVLASDERHARRIITHAPPPRAAGGGKTALLLVAVLLIAIGAGAFFYFRAPAAPEVGHMTIHVTLDGKPIERAQIFVDGQKRCDFTPCVLESLTPGTKDIRATAGEAKGQQIASVEAGKEHQITIPLMASGEAAKPATLKIASEQKDIKVSVDGVDKGSLPVELTDLEPGSVKLKFTGGETYGVLERSVELKPGEVTALEDITLPLAKVKVTFRLESNGARVLLITEKDGKKKEETLRLRKGRKLVKTLDTTKSWTVLATLKGHEDFDKPIEFDEDKAELDFIIELDEAKKEPVAASTGPGPGPGPAPTPSDTKKPEPAAGGKGKLTVNSIPPSNAIVDGRPVGSTPKTVTVSAGSHSVVFIKKGYQRKSRSCKVGAGQTKVCAARLKKKED